MIKERLSNRIKIVIIERPYDNLYQESKEVRDLLGQVWKMKLDGYKPNYKDGIMPISDADFFADHILMCEEVQGVLLPFAGSKSINTLECSKREIPLNFPVLNHVFQGCETTCSEHYEATKDWIEDKNSKNINVGYNASWTVCPRVKDDKALRVAAIQLSMHMYFHYYNYKEIDHIITAASKVHNVDKIQTDMGFNFLQSNGKDLEAYPAKPLGDALFYIMHLENGFPEEFKIKASESRHLWDERIVFTGSKKKQALSLAVA